MSDTAIPGLSASTPDPAPPPGLINVAPGASTKPLLPGQSGMVGVPFDPAQATKATSVTAQTTPYQVTPDQTVSGQIKNIIASGSPLMKQAETNAKNQMNQRGLINSSQAITAGQSALYTAAAPIATADAQTYATAAANTTKATNDAAMAGAAAANTASATNAQITTQADVQQAVARLQSDTTLSAQDRQDATQKLIAGIQSDTTLSATDKQTLSNQAIAQLQSSTTLQATSAQIASAKDLATMQTATQQAIARLQADTSMSVQDKQDASAQIIASIQSNTQLSVADKAAAAQAVQTAANNATAKEIARVQADTSLSVQDKQNASAQIIAGMNNKNAVAVQQLVNEGNLATIKANGAINVEITNLTNANKLLLQTSSAAQSLYATTLTNMAAIMQNKDLSPEQKQTALNNTVAGLQDALTIVSRIANNQSVETGLNFSLPNDQTTQTTYNEDGTINTTTTGGGGPQAHTTTPTQNPSPRPPATPTPEAVQPYPSTYVNSVNSSFTNTLAQSGMSPGAFLRTDKGAPFVAARDDIVAHTVDPATLTTNLQTARQQKADPDMAEFGASYEQAVVAQMERLGMQVPA